MKLLLTAMMISLMLMANGQAKLVIDGGIITLDNGAVLVIDNADNTAISQTGAGYIASEGALNRISWSIGAGNNATYLIPFGNASNYLPLSFTAASGTADGHFIFSTYPTQTWRNSDDLPPGVTNVNDGPNDNSAFLVDRFWQINPQGYTTRPTLGNLTFTYAKSELAPPNTIAEANLISQRWNNVAAAWDDYFPASSLNIANSTLTVTNMPGNQLYDWWTLVDATRPLPVTLLNFKAFVNNGKVVSSWQTALESNSSHFEVWRSKTLPQFDLVGTVPAAGTSSGLLTYNLTDFNPYPGLSYYRLKSVDLDGKFTWSQVAKVQIDNLTVIMLFPNPASASLTLSVTDGIVAARTNAAIYDAVGRKVQSFTITTPNQKVDISNLAAGTYHIYFSYNQSPVSVDFIKN